MVAMIGIKCGTSRFVKDDGSIIQATLIRIDTNHVTAIRTDEKDGYTAIQLASCPAKKRVNKPKSGYFSKREIAPQRELKEFRLNQNMVSNYKQGDELSVDVCKEWTAVHVAGTSKGKGFSGCVKRHNFSMQRATHGNSKSHRAPGATGQCQDPGRVNKGKKMAGQYGATRVTVKNLNVLSVDTENNILIIGGSIPGMPGGVVHVYNAAAQRDRTGDSKCS